MQSFWWNLDIDITEHIHNGLEKIRFSNSKNRIEDTRWMDYTIIRYNIVNKMIIVEEDKRRIENINCMILIEERKYSS